jgi:hypothetical protein
MSWFGNKSVELNLGANFHIGRQRIISSQVSQIPGIKLNRWNFKRRKELVFELLKNPKLDLLLMNQVTFSETPGIFDFIRKENLSKLCYLITY